MFDFDWFDDFDWLDIGILGGLADEEQERRKIEDDWNHDQENEEKF